MICRFPVPSLAELPDDIRQRIEAVQEKSGFVPNVFLMLARRPAELRAFFAYHDALMLRENGLSKGEKEMIVVATSAANDCLYCVVAHGAILRIYEKNPLIADQLATNYRKAAITPRQRAMLDFALKVATQWEKAAVLRFGRYRGLRPLLPCLFQRPDKGVHGEHPVNVELRLLMTRRLNSTSATGRCHAEDAFYQRPLKATAFSQQDTR